MKKLLETLRRLLLRFGRFLLAVFVCYILGDFNLFEVVLAEETSPQEEEGYFTPEQKKWLLIGAAAVVGGVIILLILSSGGPPDPSPIVPLKEFSQEKMDKFFEAFLRGLAKSR